MADKAKVERHTYSDGWRLYFGSCLGHHLQGALAGFLMSTGDWRLALIGLVWMVLYLAYQGLSVIRKRDSAGLDALDFLVGKIVGAAPLSILWTYLYVLDLIVLLQSTF